MLERLYAILLLAWSLVRSLVSNAIGTKPRYKQFLENYQDDRLVAISSAEREEMSTFAGCIACGQCNAYDAEAIAASKGQFAGTMEIVLASSRSIPEFDLVLRSLAFTNEERLARAERLCPAHIPIRRIVRFIRTKAEEESRLDLPAAALEAHAALK